MTFTGGQSVDLFDAPSFSGAFSQAVLPSLDAGLNWWLGRLVVSGAMVVNRAPSAADYTVDRARGLGVKIYAKDLIPAWADDDAADGDVVEFDSIINNGIRGAAVSVSGSGNEACIYYTPGTEGDDSLVYRLRDSRGGITTGNLIVKVNTVASVVENITLDAGKPSLSLIGIPGYHYAVERSGDVAFTSFTQVHDFVAPEGVYVWRDESPLAGNAFYRLRCLTP
jgi:hypothetical protein